MVLLPPPRLIARNVIFAAFTSSLSFARSVVHIYIHTLLLYLKAKTTLFIESHFISLHYLF